MALASVTVGYDGLLPGASLVAPTTSETIADPDANTYLLVVVGGTATTITLVGKGNNAYGVANPNKVLSAVTNSTRLIKVDRQFQDPTDGDADVTFSQVTGVTACVVRFT